MLVLTRGELQQIVIGKDIVLSIISINGGRVKVGVSAPKNVPVYRAEVFQRLNEERQAESVRLGDLPHEANSTELFSVH